MKKTLTDELIRFSSKDKVRAHMPGHNGGRGLSRKFKNHAFSLDVTEFSETDDLRDPKGIILNSERRCAEIFGSKRTFYLVNGSSLGIIAAVLTACEKKKKVIIDRTCHKSVVAGIILSGAEPVFVSPRFDENKGVYASIQATDIKSMLDEKPDAGAVVVTSPSYYGVCSDIRTIADVSHDSGVPLIVDEAHGAHFVFSDRLPTSAISLGADIVIESAHKTLPSLGQTALVHITKGSMIDEDRLKKNINLIQTTSPSYMLIASLDDAVMRMRKKLKPKIEETIEKIIEIKSRIEVLGDVSCLKKTDFDVDLDITKLTIDFTALGLSGYEAAEILKKKYGIYTEMSDSRHVLFYLTPLCDKKDLEKIGFAIEDIKKYKKENNVIPKMVAMPDIKLCMSPKEAHILDSEEVSLSEARGRIAADIVVCCPPCAPITVPGQIIDDFVIEYIKQYTDMKKILVCKKF